MDTRSDKATSAGRGGIAIAGAKMYFILVGLVQQVALKHLLGLQDYGGLSKVQGAASLVYNPVVYTGVQGVSRAVSGAPEDEQEIATRRALKVHAGLGIPIAIAFFFLAPLITEHGMKAPHLTTATRIIAGVILFYSLYAPLVGVLNGRRRFGWQAALDALFATLRTAGLLLGAWLMARQGSGIEGALAGFVIAAASIFFLSLPIAKTGKAGAGRPTFAEHTRFVAPLFGGQLALNLLFQSDFQLLGRFAAQSAAQAGIATAQADALAGAYRASQLFCFLPYQLLLSVTFVLFPLLASAHRDGDRAAMANYVRTGVRLALILSGVMVAVTASLPGPLLRLVFGADTAGLGAQAMFVLALGLGAFAIFGILTTVLTSLGRERASAACTMGALALVVALCFVRVRGQAYGPDLLMRTATSTAVGLLLATVVAAWLVHRTAGAVGSPLTLLRVAVALGLAIGLGRWLPEPGKLMTLVYAALLAVTFTAVLIITGELGRADLALLRRVVKSKPTKA